MRKLRASRPSPALIVAVVALVAALGGTAIAANGINGNLIKPKTVGGGKLKQFTAGLLKKQSLGGGKVKPDTLTGFQVNESTLSTVPSANSSNTANSVAGDTRYSVKLGFGQAQTLATVGPFTLTAQCIQNGTDQGGEAGRDIARVLISTSEVNSVFKGSTDSKSGSATGLLNPTTPEGERVAIEYSVASGGNEYQSGGYVTAYAPNGTGLVSPAGANSAAIGLFGSACVFHGAVFKA
jgi:hypothetical protein